MWLLQDLADGSTFPLSLVRHHHKNPIPRGHSIVSRHFYIRHMPKNHCDPTLRLIKLSHD